MGLGIGLGIGLGPGNTVFLSFLSFFFFFFMPKFAYVVTICNFKFCYKRRAIRLEAPQQPAQPCKSTSNKVHFILYKVKRGNLERKFDFGSAAQGSFARGPKQCLCGRPTCLQ